MRRSSGQQRRGSRDQLGDDRFVGKDDYALGATLDRAKVATLFSAGGPYGCGARAEPSPERHVLADQRSCACRHVLVGLYCRKTYSERWASIYFRWNRE